MVFTKRRDGVHLADVPAMRRIMPHLMPTRAESIVYYPHRIEVDGLLAWLDEVNRDRPVAERVTLFHVLLTALARTVHLRPEVNRFIAGRRTYQHKELSISFIVKKALTDEADETEVRLVFTGEETVDEVRHLATEALARKRGDQRGSDDQLVDFFAGWPRPLLSLIGRTVRTLDYHNALPAFLEDAIPLYTSIYLVNLGSLGANAPFHHLYELGSASVFVAIGRVSDQPVVEDGQVVARKCLDVAYTLDERASDGFYFVRTAEVFRLLVSRPQLLTTPGLTVEEILAAGRAEG
jgi:hypothetical protein